MLSKYGSKVGPCVVRGLLNALHVNQTPHRVVNQSELLDPNLTRSHLAQQSVGKGLHEVTQSRVTNVRLNGLGEVEEAGSNVAPKCPYPWEVGYGGVLALGLKPVDSAESQERDFVANATDEEGQDALASLLCPLAGVVDFHGGHELTDQLRVENLWVSSKVPHTQLNEQVLEVRSEA